jgi:diaminopimelate epimerase
MNHTTPTPATLTAFPQALARTLNFTKMHGAGNDFVVLNALQGLPDLSIQQFTALADRRYGIGCDQFLIVAPPQNPANDFAYRIVNCDGSEVEQCGNGARCFMRFIRDEGLTHKTSVRVEVATGVIVLHELADGLIEVDMGAPRFEPAALPFQPDAPNNLPYLRVNTDTAPFMLYQLPLLTGNNNEAINSIDIGVVSMGNPHAVQIVADVDTALVAQHGSQIEHHPAFPKRVNVGFMQVLDKHNVKLRVWERGAGETLACGTGACAAAVVGIQMGVLSSPVTVQARGGVLHIVWHGGQSPVLMRGPAVSVFKGSVVL